MSEPKKLAFFFPRTRLELRLSLTGFGLLRQGPLRSGGAPGLDSPPETLSRPLCSKKKGARGKNMRDRRVMNLLKLRGERLRAVVDAACDVSRGSCDPWLQYVAQLIVDAHPELAGEPSWR